MSRKSGPDLGPDTDVSPLIEHARQACLMHRVSFEGTDSQSVRVPGEAVEELLQSLASTPLTSVQQIVPFAPGLRRREAFAGVFWRRLAKRCDVLRYYLVPSGEEILRKADEQAKEDRRFDLESRPVPVDGWSDRPQVPMNDLWLIDDRVVVRREMGASGAGSWLVSGHTSEVESARRLLAEVQQTHSARLRRPGPAARGPDLTDTMLESAQMLYALAQMSCTGSQYIDAKDCRWYHGLWQYLRLFDMVSSPSWHAKFYADALRRRILDGARKVLISGTADYTTLAFVLEAARTVVGTVPDDLEIHVLDLCQTPLLACQWYAGRLGCRDQVQVHTADITNPCALADAGIGDGAGFDLIVADAFLTRFDPLQARRVLGAWHGLLASGGTILTTVRLHPRNDYRVHDTDDLAANDRYRVTDPTDDFELRLRERAAGWRGMLAINLDDLSSAGRQYALRMKSNDLGDARDITDLFESEHFVVTGQNEGRVHGELIGTEYLRIAATRP